MESMMMVDNEERRPITNLVQEEVDEPHHHQANDIGPVLITRSYECIFCKRGFTTAQALGGHMNIHRKDRAKTTSSSSKPINYNLSNNTNSSTQYLEEERHGCYYAAGPAPPRFYQPAVFASDHYPPTSSCYTSSSSSPNKSAWPIINHEENNHHQEAAAFHGVFITSDPSRELDDEKRPMSLNLQYGWSLGEEDRDYSKRSFRDEIYKEDDDLDLELRLGHDP